MEFEGPTAAGLMYSDTGGDGPVVVLLPPPPSPSAPCRSGGFPTTSSGAGSIRCATTASCAERSHPATCATPPRLAERRPPPRDRWRDHGYHGVVTRRDRVLGEHREAIVAAAAANKATSIALGRFGGPCRGHRGQ